MEEPSKANALGVSPLGLTIARKQLEGGDDDLLMGKQPRKSRRQKQTVTTTSYTKKILDGKPPKNASWMAFLEGVTLYGTCLVLPSLLGMILRREEQQLMWNQFKLEICGQSAWLCWNLFGAVLEPEAQPEPLTFAKNFVAPDTYLSDIGVVLLMTFSMAFFRVLLVHWLVPNHLAPQQMEALVRCKSIHLLSSDYKRTLTPRAELPPRNVITTDSFQKESPRFPSLPLFPGEEPGQDLGYEKLEYKTDKDGKQDSNQDDDFFFRRLSSGGLGIDFDDDDNNDYNAPDPNAPDPNPRIIQTGGFLPPCCPQQEEKSEQNFLGDFADDENDDHRPQSPLHMPLDSALEDPLQFGTPARGQPQEGDEESLGWKRRGSTASLAAAAAAAVQEEEDHHGEEAVPLPRPQRLFAAPRYATAVFRLLYCTLSGAMAWYLFRDSDFWPSYVGGHGSTARCWDLGGSLSLAKSLDSDFDHRNTVLRRFFLVQASYHLHSGAFHVFSVVLLHCLKRDEAKANEKKKNFLHWVLPLLRSLIHPRAMFQHSLSLIFLSVSYVFSSLRRLGAVGMFALDMSSWALHLLQTCLNAPANSVLSKPKVIKGVWGLVVLPSFFYFRFYVWPMLGYSSIGESEQWLAQLESTLVPGSALWFRRTFLLWMTLWMGFHAIHFKRLVFHPHIQRIMGPGGEQYGSAE